MSLPVADEWFAIDHLDDGVVRLREHHIDSYAVGHLWLIAGRERAVVFDAGSGIVSPAPVIDGLVSTPVLCVSSCSGFDHAGGWHSFASRGCHADDADDLADPREENAEIGEYLTLDRFTALPFPGFDPADHQMVGAASTETLVDGQQLDLGDRELSVLHTPGRSPGGLSLWDAQNRVLFAGEILYDGDHGPAWPPPDPVAYVDSLERLRTLPVRLVHPGHYESLDRDRFLALTAEQLGDLARRFPELDASIHAS